VEVSADANANRITKNGLLVGSVAIVKWIGIEIKAPGLTAYGDED
jgi:hypothetical protein